jgi:thymidylate synthase (FAD)
MRYSELEDDEVYIPENDYIGVQSTANKQGSTGIAQPEAIAAFKYELTRDCLQLFESYHTAINTGAISRETARIGLPVNTYTKWVWKIDLHNLFHFLKLRMDSRAQMEIRAYANAIFKLIQPVVPEACRAFSDYSLNSVTFSAADLQLCSINLNNESHSLSKGEYDEFLEKIKKIKK